MITEERTLKEQVLSTLFNYRFNYLEYQNRVLDTLTGRIAGGIFFEHFVKDAAPYEGIKGDISKKVGRNIRVILERRAFNKIDLITSKVT